MRPPAELGFDDAERVRVSIFLSVFDVHINRARSPGASPGPSTCRAAFLNAALDKASEENERLRDRHRQPRSGAEIAVVQIAGLIARRIVTFVQRGR